MTSDELAAWGASLESSIRNRLMLRRWYREHRYLGWADMERENALLLRELLRVRAGAKAARRLERAR